MIIKGFKKFKCAIVSSIALLLITIILSGCTNVEDKEMVSMIDEGKPIGIILTEPSYTINIQGTDQENLDWISLEELTTYDKELRAPFNMLFKVKSVDRNGISRKLGCLFIDENGDRNGNTTLEDAFRNQFFVEKYSNDKRIKDDIATLALETYTDIEDHKENQIAAVLNGYYNLLPNAIDPISFNPNQSLTREDFYTLVFKSDECVRELEEDVEFNKAIGGETYYSEYAKEVSEFGFLDIGNKSLDELTYKSNISRAEAIYMLVNKHFSDKLKEVTGEEEAFNDTKNGGDLALQVGLKEQNKDTKDIQAKDRWQSYILKYMIENQNKAMQEELYKTMVVAKEVGLLSENESRWDEPLSKSEGIILVVNTHLAKNKLNGYITTMEDGEEQTLNTEIPEEFTMVDPNKMLSSGITLEELKLHIDGLEKFLLEDDFPKEEVEEVIRESAIESGSTLEEVRAVSDDMIGQNEEVEEAPVVKPSQSKPSQSKPSQSTPVEKEPNKIVNGFTGQMIPDGENTYDGNDPGIGGLK